MMAEGMGFYERQTAEARSINTDTVMRWLIAQGGIRDAKTIALLYHARATGLL